MFSFRFHKLLKNEPYVHVHISNLAAQTGVTRFTQIHDHWGYSKDESLQPEQLQQYTHLLIEAKSKYSPSIKSFTQTHVVLDSVDTFSHVAVNYKLIPPVRIKTRPAIFILEKKNFREYPRDFSYENISVEEHETISQEETIIEEPSSNINEDFRNSDKAKDENDETENIIELISEENTNNSKEVTEEPTQLYAEVKIDKSENIIEEVNEIPDIQKDFKSYRQERKKKAIEKIKSETRKEVVASAKEKLREIMKRHKHIAVELSENNVQDDQNESEDIDGRGDVPDIEIIPEVDATIVQENLTSKPDQVNDLEQVNDSDHVESLLQTTDTSHSNENLDAIVEEVINRLIDRKVYDDKTKLEDIKLEDRLMIQKIVEEVLAEKINYKSSSDK